MTSRILTTRIERPAAEVTAWLARPGADERLTPPWLLAPAAGTVVSTPPFSDATRPQVFSTAIKSLDNTSCTLTEEIRLGDAEAHDRPDALLDRHLAYRHATIRDDIERAAAYGYVRRLRIAIAGASSSIGRALIPYLKTQNHEVIALVRDPARNTSYDPAPLATADVLVNLSGSSITDGKWDQPHRDLIWESRAGSTRALVTALATLKHRPFVFLNASAIGYYGSRGDDILDENSPPPAAGASFLADVCRGWEQEAGAAAELGIRTACLRFGSVLTPAGGALAAMRPYFKKKFGAKLGHGRQWLSWISIDDAIASIYHIILARTCDGPVNLTSPNPVPNAVFAETLARALGKKKVSRVSRWRLRLRYGIDFANETMLASTRAIPAKLRAAGYDFRHPTLETALAHLL